MDSTKISEIISGIAKIIRIFGLNARVEGARSGEYSKGFEIVAKEITKLADQSSVAVNEIRQILEVMKEKVDEVSSSA